MRGFAKQRGWIGLVALVFALVIVALTAQKVLKEYGLLPGGATRAESATRVDRSQQRVEARKVVPDDPAPSTENPMDRVRRLGDMVHERAGKLDDR
jgi:hypothetical protein